MLRPVPSAATYRATGADLPFGRPERAHGVAMEGYFWRITDPITRRVLVALIGVNRGPRGLWATLGVATSPDPSDVAAGQTTTPGRMGGLVTAAVDGAWASPDLLAAGSGGLFRGDVNRVTVEMDGASVDLGFTGQQTWPHRLWGGSSWFQTVPGLNQYWHPWLLGGKATGQVTVNGHTWTFADAQVYGEKNWGRGGFPDSWWWGQAQGFDDGDACVAFAGGQVHAGPLRTEVTGLVVRLPGGRVIRLGNPGTSPVTARVGDDEWRLRGRSARWSVEVHGHAPLHRAHLLPVPLPAEHRNTVGAIEHLSGRLSVIVRRDSRLFWRGTSHVAGLEHGGLARAEAELARRGGSALPAP